MSDLSMIDAATKRLAQALDALEAAIDRRQEADQVSEGAATQLQALSTDRARLAAELDRVSARARQLETANREAAQRIDEAVETIQTVLGENG